MAGSLSEKLKEVATNVVVTAPNRLSITVDAPNLVGAAQKLRDLGFDHAKSVTGIDYPEENRIGVLYHVSSFEDLELAKVILEIRTSVSRSDPRLHTVVEVWPSAEYLERETSDLMGVAFEGLRASGRLMLPENFEGAPPLRKDFKIRTEGIEA